MVMEVTGTRVECTTVVLLSGHGIKLSSEYSCLYTKTSAAISLGQRSFWLQWETVNTGTHNWSKCWEWVMVECSALNEISVIPSKAQRTSHKRDQNKVRAREWKGWLWNTIFWTWHNHCSHELPAAVVAYTRLDRVDTFHQGWGRESMKPHLWRTIDN